MKSISPALHDETDVVSVAPGQRAQLLSRRGEPVWELALLFPPQGEWNEEQYLELENAAFVELVDGCLEFLPMPNPFHQFIAKYLAKRLDEFVPARYPGHVLAAPCPIRLWPKHMREPDVFYVRPEQLPDVKRPPTGAELVIEVVSEGAANRQRDLVDKPRDYAKAGVKEYWIVDPDEQTITVLVLDGEAYRVHGVFKSGETAASVLLEGFSAPVANVFAAGSGVT